MSRAWPQGINPIQAREVVGYCRTHIESVHLSQDRSTLCFNGTIDSILDTRPVRDLAEGGVFVIRSKGGNVEKAVEIANVLRAKNAKILIYDYCLSPHHEQAAVAPLRQQGNPKV
jgi:hypothetical protein